MTQFVAVSCIQCKVVFGLNLNTHEVLKQSSAAFHCPHGHSMVFVKGETEADKLRRERDRLKQREAQLNDAVKHERDRRETAERSAIAYKGQATRIRNRVKAGVCPCCNRTVKQLAQHMQTQHPEFQPEELAA
ncbi:hypothetical protein [Sphingomonas paeninsulae]|uniref:hypothetical protein n=1 Tax=Sphingomonas paeninsulae TaxID=2319844 RepID=UPI0013CE9A71|nr:hypothetical protein [Sphingomonas paeninsulae]